MTRTVSDGSNSQLLPRGRQVEASFARLSRLSATFSTGKGGNWKRSRTSAVAFDQS